MDLTAFVVFDFEGAMTEGVVEGLRPDDKLVTVDDVVTVLVRVTTVEVDTDEEAGDGVNASAFIFKSVDRVFEIETGWE